MHSKGEKQIKPQIHLCFVSSKLYLFKLQMNFSQKISQFGINLLLGHIGTEMMPFKMKFTSEALQNFRGSLP